MGGESKKLLFRDLSAVDKSGVALGPKHNSLVPYRGHERQSSVYYRPQ
jgi:hypothetical protein